MQLIQQEQTPARQTLVLEPGPVEVQKETQSLIFYQSNGPVVLVLEGSSFQELTEALTTPDAQEEP